MPKSFFYNLFLLVIVCLTAYSAAQDIAVTPILDKSEYAPGDTVVVALQCALPEGFHLYGNPLGPGIGKPTVFTLNNHNGITWIDAKKQPAVKFRPPIGKWVWAYDDEALFFIRGILSRSAAVQVIDTVVLEGLICEKSCIMVSKDIILSVPVSKNAGNEKSFSNNTTVRKEYFLADSLQFEIKSTSLSTSLSGDIGSFSIDFSGVEKPPEEENIPQWDYEPQEKEFSFNILLAILLAFVAGIILNVMPCVLPVLGIKILSFSQGAGSSKRVAMTRSLVFAAGMISIFLVLASFAAFAGLSWGEQFQNPKVLVAIVCVIFVFALGMFDVFMILVPSSVSELEQKSTKGKGYLDDFVKGMFTTVLATPCSGPLLGATLAWTLMQKPVVIYAVFVSLGAGMASPYILFSASSRLMKMIPKPGAWMEDFKHFMGFLLFGFALYLMIGLPRDMVIPTLGLSLFLTVAVMVYTRFSPFGSSIRRKVLGFLVAGCIAGIGWHASFNTFYNFMSDEAAAKAEKESGTWEEFTAQKLLHAHAIGRHVIVDFTANWCMNCQFNKVAVYHSKEVNDLIKQKNILALKADLTQENPPVESLLHHLGSRSVPFFAVFPGDDPYNPVIMRDIVNKKRVVAALKGLAVRKR